MSVYLCVFVYRVYLCIGVRVQMCMCVGCIYVFMCESVMNVSVKVILCICA